MKGQQPEPVRGPQIDQDPLYGTSQQYALKHTWTDQEGEHEEYFGPWWRDYTVSRSRDRRALNSPPNHTWEVVTLQHTDIIDKGLRADQTGSYEPSLGIEMRSKYGRGSGTSR